MKHQVEQTLYSLSEDAPGRPERRNGERYLSLLRVGALVIEGRRELCLVRNVSGGGMLIRPYSPVAEGTAVAVELKHGETVSGVAKWIEDGLVGIAFDQPIDVVALLTSPENGPQPRMPRIAVSGTDDPEIAQITVSGVVSDQPPAVGGLGLGRERVRAS